MFKTLFISVNLIGVLLLNSFVPREVKVTQDAPVFATIGDTHDITVTIDKGKIEGFAKYQVNVPTGLTIEPIDASGASFTFKNGEAKFIWMALPEDDSFSLSYRLTVESSCKVGNNDMEHWFSYLEKNDRKTTVAPVHVIEIATDDVSNANVDEGLANGTRKITKLNEDHYLVEIELYKDGIKGFAKLQENLPNGVSAEPVKKANGVFTQLDDKVKVVWFSIPEEENLKIVYELFSTKGPIGDAPITGAFTYLKDNETKTVDIMQGEIVDVSDVADAATDTDSTIVDNTDAGTDTKSSEDTDGTAPSDSADTAVIDPANDNTANDSAKAVDSMNNDPIVDTTTDNTDAGEDNTVVDNTSTDNSDNTGTDTTADSQTDGVVVDALSDITSTPSPDKGVTYRVQIMAGKNVVGEKYLSKRHKFSMPFDIENHQGWVKYTTGTHPKYKEARDSREKITDNYNFDGPFVTAYNDGVRISVQEALMISRQQWYQ